MEKMQAQRKSAKSALCELSYKNYSGNVQFKVQIPFTKSYGGCGYIDEKATSTLEHWRPSVFHDDDNVVYDILVLVVERATLVAVEAASSQRTTFSKIV